jgi:hypothetical protein
MAFLPSETNLGTLNENVNFSFTITYEEAGEIDPETSLPGPSTILPVTIVAMEENPATVIISGDTISGYYFDSFINELKYKNLDKNLITTNKFEKIENLYEMVRYAADLNRTRVFSYLATTTAGSQIYTITVQNDWTNGKNSLQAYVRTT